MARRYGLAAVVTADIGVDASPLRCAPRKSTHSRELQSGVDVRFSPRSAKAKEERRAIAAVIENRRDSRRERRRRHALEPRDRPDLNFHIIDIVDIGGRKKIGDKLLLTQPGEYCMVLEVCTHTVGFDDQASKYAQQTNVKATTKLADKIKGKMGAPTATFTTSYLYNAAEDCCKELKELLFWGFCPPVGERIWVEGIGAFTQNVDRALDDSEDSDSSDESWQEEVSFLDRVSLADAERFNRALGLACDEIGLHSRYLGGLAVATGPGPEPSVRPGIWRVDREAPSTDLDGLLVQGRPILHIELAPSEESPRRALAIEISGRGHRIQLEGTGGRDWEKALADIGDEAPRLPELLRKRLV